MQEPLALLNQISDELNADLDLDKMLQRVIDLTVAHFGATTGSIMLFDKGRRVSRYILQQQDISHSRARQIVGQVLTEGFAGWVLDHERGDVIADTIDDERWLTYPNQAYTVRSAMATPLIRRQRILGLLTINHASEPHRFDGDDLALLNAIAGQAAIALENARLFRQTERERATLSAIINATQDLVIVTYDDDHKVLLLNPAARATLNAPADWKRRPLSEVTTLTDVINLFESADSTGTELQIADGKTLLTSMMDVPNVGRLALLHNITALKALNTMKTEFITTFTHDLSAPLLSIKGQAQFLKADGPLTEQQSVDLHAINLAVEQMRTLIRDLLELNRVESLEDFFTCEIALNDTVEKAMHTFQPTADSKQVSLSMEGNQPKVIIQGNPTLIARAVDNLVENAIKYTRPNGSVDLTLSRNGHQACLAVQDTGVGISEKSLPQVFDKFFRAHPAFDNEVPGSGLGLSIVKAIVERHGGEVSVESETDVGSTFTIALPLNGNSS